MGLTSQEIKQAKELKLSTNFSLYELIRSNKYPDYVQYPSDDIISKLRMHCQDVLQPLRDQFGRITVSSGYRNPSLNTKVGGVSDSIHKIYHNSIYQGTATDIQPAEADLVKIMSWIEDNLPEARCVIIYRNCEALGINNPFLHIDRRVENPSGNPTIFMEKIKRGSYVYFDKSEFEPYKD